MRPVPVKKGDRNVARCGHKHHLKKAHRSYPVIGRHKGRADGEFNDLARFMPEHLVAHATRVGTFQDLVDERNTDNRRTISRTESIST
jgi:hypothetical protein